MTDGDGNTKAGIAERVRTILDREMDRLDEKSKGMDRTGENKLVCGECRRGWGLTKNDADVLETLVKVEKLLRESEPKNPGPAKPRLARDELAKGLRGRVTVED